MYIVHLQRRVCQTISRINAWNYNSINSLHHLYTHYDVAQLADNVDYNMTDHHPIEHWGTINEYL